MATVVMGDMCTKYHGQTYYYQATMLIIAINFFVVVIYCYHGDGNDGRHVCTKYHGHTHYYQATMLEIVIDCLRLFVVVIYCYHGDGSAGRHVCTKFHSHTYYYQQLIGCYVGNCVL